MPVIVPISQLRVSRHREAELAASSLPPSEGPACEPTRPTTNAGITRGFKRQLVYFFVAVKSNHGFLNLKAKEHFATLVSLKCECMLLLTVPSPESPGMIWHSWGGLGWRLWPRAQCIMGVGKCELGERPGSPSTD